MASQTVALLTMERYLELERAAAEKHEFIDGEMVAMSGGSPRHAIITSNISALLKGQLRSTGCVTFSPDVKVCIARGKMIAYPDVPVVCGNPEFLDQKQDVLNNPTILVEVLSPSTRNYDRGLKAARYRLLPSLREFLLVGQDPVFVEHDQRRTDGTWETILHREMSDVIRLGSINCDVPMTEVYADLEKY